MDPVGVLVVDDQELSRRALCELVEATAGMSVVGASCSGEAALEAADRLTPQLVLMDVRMPGMGGVEAARRLVAGHRDIVVILVSADGAHPQLARACGAAAFMCKQQLSTRALREAWSAHRAGAPE